MCFWIRIHIVIVGLFKEHFSTEYVIKRPLKTPAVTFQGTNNISLESLKKTTRKLTGSAGTPTEFRGGKFPETDLTLEHQRYTKTCLLISTHMLG